ncbi:MAG TPA: hypothetical protein PLJ12_08785 [Planctomycetota bacterium]|nr:hypothetical protein [Planctomycetota bacterium]
MKAFLLAFSLGLLPLQSAELTEALDAFKKQRDDAGGREKLF